MIEIFSGAGLTTIIVLELGVTCALVGLIWLIQLVHYPLFSSISPISFVEYERGHCRRISFVVIPLMCGEALLCGLHLLNASFTLSAVIGTALLIVIWASTLLIQTPLHSKLSEQFDAHAHRILVQSNWIRTISWTTRAGILLLVLLSRVQPIS